MLSNHPIISIIYHNFSFTSYDTIPLNNHEGGVIGVERLVKNGYVKMIAIDVNDLESKIIDERNTNFLCDIENFQKKYSSLHTIKCVYIHMDDNYDISFDDYTKVHPHLHPFDYMRNIVKRFDGKLIKGTDYLRITHEDDYVHLNEIDLQSK